jgi:Uma2 family endonuclease
MFQVAHEKLKLNTTAMTALTHLGPISVIEYLAGEQHGAVKHEYLGGTVHAMSGGTNRHNTIALNSAVHLANSLRGKPCQPFNSDTKIRIELPDHTRFYYPDAMVVCDPNPPTDHFQDRPVVVIEVLSESTRRADLREKRDAYLTIPSLRALLLVESETPAVLVHRRSAAGGFAIETYEGIGAVIPLPEIDGEIPLTALYDRAGIA